MQLTLSYAALLVLAGVALFAVGFLILRFVPEGNLVVVGGGFAPGRDDLIDVFVPYSLFALLGLAVVGLGGGWLLAGRMLRPLMRITDAARQARDGSLSHRIDLPGRQNELAELADTFDDMLGQVQRSVEEQRRFAANASHELRTPLAVMRTMLEVAGADPAGRDTDALLERLAETNERSVALTEALLTLAEVEHRDHPRVEVDIDAVVEEVVEEMKDASSHSGIRIETDLAAGTVMAAPMLLRQLVTNLVQNAIAYNHPGGVVRVATRRAADGTTLEISNTGDVLDQTLVDTFMEPFVRGEGRTRRSAERPAGSGLGLAIVSSIVAAHGWGSTVTAREGGGLSVRVSLVAAR
ncbi:HAMP domain-containing sensor histidine kinase [Microbacterium sp. SLBN-146]|uniref:sensor histidine kinase n=1 Tax=Microbacterium sp. SLBN-146 TaxID=2768457 RepID=UPI001170F4E9|nr:HAMP domain-containing sensor histidine kinase [Microbacterium sp. SLBN-146]TQJ30003.1 two-component system sensor histidine kinase VanS [Microbacterium sp. SLBN-146]